MLNSKVINIGHRQKGRFRFGEVMDANNIYEINQSVNKVLNCEVYEKSIIKNIKKENFNNFPSKKIVKILKELKKY